MTDTHPELDAFLAAIRDNPDDDTPRLVFADWLEEHKQEERAELIRVQCELAKRGNHDVSTAGLGLKHCCNCGPEQICDVCNKLRRRERELLRRTPVLGALWALQERFGGDGGSWAFHRGFLSRIRCSWFGWQAHADAILGDKWVPGLDEVELTTWPPDLAEVMRLTNAPELRVVRGEFAITGALKIRWPTVRKWTLPPEPVRIDLREEPPTVTVR